MNIPEPVARVHRALRELGHVPKTSGSGWTCRCPAHDDTNPSLSINVGDDGRALLCCHAGCSTEMIVGALGLKIADIMPEGHAPRVEPHKPAGKARTFASAREAVADLERTRGPRAAQWVYHNATGEPVGVIARWNRPDGKKDIRPVSRNGTGWALGGLPEPRPLYMLPEILNAPPEAAVYVAEGEKAADALVTCGLVATTSPHGSKSASKTDWSPLAGRDIVILPDHDDSGERYAQDVARLARAAGARSVKIVRLADQLDGRAPAGFDAADLLMLSGDDTGSVRLAIEDLAAAAPEAKPEPATFADTIGSPVVLNMGDVEAEEVSWLWPGRIPRGRLSLLVGRPGEGKSFATIDAAARVSTGSPWPDGSACERGDMLLVSAEDDPGDTIRPRLDAHNADVKHVHLLAGVRAMTRDGKPVETAFTLADLEPLERAAEGLPDLRMIVIDPIGSYLGGGVDAHRDNEIRGVLAPLAALAQRTGAAVLLVAHTRKAKADHADDTVLGSRAFTGIARSVLHLMADPDDDGRRLLLPGKMNLAAPAPGLAFTIDGDPARVRWEPGFVSITADDVLARSGGKPTESDETTEWLRDILSGGVPVAVAEIKETAKTDGFGWRSVERAKVRLGVEATREGFASGGRWVWVMPTPTRTDSPVRDLSKDRHPPAFSGQCAKGRQGERVAVFGGDWRSMDESPPETPEQTDGWGAI